eukprot:TRINITY_DN37560_c0_g1_i1.p1 TRINITY_DN37560_c0_g1~~TRINITY_DN37560_c0_g1_i1.p1  ORF type:complete len:808 (+),score=157.75 TRINITY_DN37560_c0_g1_i1:130-2553(+)
MGCCGSKPEYVSQLDQVECTCVAEKTGVGREKLDVMKRCSAELKDAMNAIIANGAKDKKSLYRIEALSEDILTNLQSRITKDLLAVEDSQAAIDEIMDVAKDLDCVRAVKATTFIDSKLAPLRMAADQGAVQEAQRFYNEALTLIKSITSADKLVEGCHGALDFMMQMHKLQPSNKKVATALLAECSLIAQLMSNHLMQVVLNDLEGKDTGGLENLRACALKLDGIASKSAAVPEPVTWEAVAPKLDATVNTKALEICKTCLSFADDALGKENGAEAYSFLVQLKPWWPYAETAEGCASRLRAVFDLSEKQAMSAFERGLETGNTEMTNGIKQFAESMDTLHTDYYEGKPGGLLALLRAFETGKSIERPLGALEAELAKTSGRSLAGILQALKAVTEVGGESLGAGGLSDRAATACEKLEEWALSAVRSCEVDKVEGLEKFAAEYDMARQPLSPPLEPPALLEPRIGAAACEAQLVMAEKELEKEALANPKKVLEYIEHAGRFEPKEGLSPPACARLDAVVSKTCARVLQSAEKALADGNTAKVEGLTKFSQQFDVALSSLAGGGHGRNLMEKVQEAAEKGARESAQSAAVEEKLNHVDSELSKEAGMNPNALLESLQGVKPLLEAVDNPPGSMTAHILATFDKLKERMCASCKKASAEDNTKKLTALMDFAAKFDVVQASLGDASPGFLGSVAMAGANVDLSDCERELAKDKGMNSMALLNSCKNLRTFWPHIGSQDPEAVAQCHNRLREICVKVHERINTAFDEDTENKRKRNTLIAFAGNFDESIDGLEGALPANLKSQLEDKA